MNLKRQLRTTRNQILEIDTDHKAVVDHFQNPNNYADIVLNQINTETLYDPILEDEDELIIIDIGANIGLFSLHAHDRAKVIYSLEPTPTHFEKLTELTKNYPNIRPFNVALNDKDEEITFYISDQNSTMNSSVNKYGKEVKVQGRSLGSFIKELGLTHVDFIKCDIEGSEMRAITDQTISEVKDIVDCWFIEVHATSDKLPWPANMEVNRTTIADIFVRQGYEVQRYGVDTLYVFKNKD
jgi:FkbM family methyltransferase